MHPQPLALLSGGCRAWPGLWAVGGCSPLVCYSSNNIPLVPCREFKDVETASFHLDMW